MNVEGNLSNLSAVCFTPREYQIELLSAAKERNIIICLSSVSAREFCALKLIQELSHEIRRKENRKISLFLTSSKSAYNLIYYLTDLKVINLNGLNDDEIEWENIYDNQVILLETKQCLDALECYYLDLNRVNLIVVDECHNRTRKSDITDIFFNYYKATLEKPKIFGLAGPIHSAACSPARLGAELEYLETLLKAKAETASDIVTVLRYTSKPIEFVVECGISSETEVSNYIRNLVLTKKAYLLDHRYELSEIYSEDEYKDELENIPDPKDEPLRILDDFLLILDELGVYCADKAALIILMQTEKLKVKTKYERHFLLLCLVTSTLVQIRSFCDLVFQSIKTELERIEKFSTPKISRILEILRLFKPTNAREQKAKDKPKVERAEEIEKGDSIECEKINKIEADLETLKASVTKMSKEIGSQPIVPVARNHHRFSRFKNRRRFFPRQRLNQNESDILCGLIFCSSVITTKVLFCLFCEMSRHDPDLKFLNVQYTIDKIADPITDAKEAENEHRKQEEVLKKFRMHECNLLISTTVLEEGYDLPKCNLVVRFDQPSTYRSYVYCKGRARANNALHIIMVSPKINENYYKSLLNEQLSPNSHNYSCNLIRNKANSNIDDDDDEDESESDSDSSDSKSSTCSEESVPFVQEKCVEDCENNQSLQLELYDPVEKFTKQQIDKLAEYMEIEKMLIRKCENKEPPISEISHAEKFTSFIQSYQPLASQDSVQVNLSTAISLINKYCAKLPSDTFTKLTPLWRCCKTVRNGVTLYQYTLRLPLNSPMKCDINGIPMPTRTLARRVAALIACRMLHKSGELDDNLQPIGKEGFKAIEPDWDLFELEKVDEELNNENCDLRPGTTKRRQYYYKRIASVFSGCRPTTKTKAFLYHITMVLQCPIPEEQNTRGRKIYPPEEAVQSFGILTTKKIPKISAFPIFTRSGEVKVSLQLIKSDVTLDDDQLQKINTFINYTFTNVLRLRKYLMLFDPEAVENSFFVVPVIRDNNESIEVDWNFLSVIQTSIAMTPQFVSDEDRKNQTFDNNRFKDAVVMPWYRNQDQPQYFYVAEICYHLTPESSFPGENYGTFREYYFKKYNIEIQNNKQPLLDVDHTSARLNFLTPRYVNRKGVALPTSSEETKRAKRENLEQKQILVPELCTVHPFPASLWRAAVCLPCVLYRINALLLADEIRMEVSADLGLGVLEVKDENFEWPMLNFGWTLADVLKKTREAKMINAQSDEVNIEDIEYENKENGNQSEDSAEKADQEKENSDKEKSANDILEEVDQKAKGEHILEIGTWSNEMAQNLDEFDDELGILPSNLQMCSSRNIRYGSPTSWDMEPSMAHTKITNHFNDNYYASDSDDDFDDIDDYESMNGGDNSDNNDDEYGLKIEFKNDHLAEAVESEAEIKRRQKRIEFINETIVNEKRYQMAKNISIGYDFIDDTQLIDLEENIKLHEEVFEKSTTELRAAIRSSGILVKQDDKVPARIRNSHKNNNESVNDEDIDLFQLIPYLDKNEILSVIDQENVLTIDDLYELNTMYEQRHSDEVFEVVGCGDLFDHFADRDRTKMKENGQKTIKLEISNDLSKLIKKREESSGQKKSLDTFLNPVPIMESLAPLHFSFDHQPDLNNHPGPNPSIILQALTMSNANDGINLERLETIGDSFLKYAITTYLYCTYENVNEGKLSYLRSKQVSNLNLYRLGRKKILGESMIATKFEPQDNWLPPCYFVPKELEQALIDAKIPVCYWNLADLPDIKQLSSEKICSLVRERAERLGMLEDSLDCDGDDAAENVNTSQTPAPPKTQQNGKTDQVADNFPCFIPYNLVTQHSIPDKSIADCVEALIGAYLIDCGARGALLFMAWLGIRVLPIIKVPCLENRIAGSTKPVEEDGKMMQIIYGHWMPPKSPLLHSIPDAENTLELLLDGFQQFEIELDYKFNDRSYLLQAMTHASYTPNRLTDCYQRLEFLGDAVLDYLITRHLYEDRRLHSPGALTDLRSALVNNTIFASLAVRHRFHKYFRHLSPALNEVIDRFVRIQHENGHCISEEYYLMSEDECDEAEDVEVPKALGDVFESVAGAVFLDSNMSLDAVWKVYYKMMGPEIEQFSRSVPKSPIRELLELEPETAKFGKPEKLADGRRVRVTVEVFGKGIFRGIGRNYRIAKCTAAKCALRQLKKNNLINKKHAN